MCVLGLHGSFLNRHTRALAGTSLLPPAPGRPPGLGPDREVKPLSTCLLLSLGFFSSIMSPRPLTTWAAPAPRPAPPPNLGLARRCREERKDLLPGPLASATWTRRAAARALPFLQTSQHGDARGLFPSLCTRVVRMALGNASLTR